MPTFQNPSPVPCTGLDGLFQAMEEDTKGGETPRERSDTPGTPPEKSDEVNDRGGHTPPEPA
jgi:hypothetical protein